MFASAFSTFIWSGSWSFLRRTPAEYLLCIPFFLLATVAVLRGWRQHTGEERLVHIAAAVLLVPMVGGTAGYIVDAVRHGISVSVLGGYYWLVAWPALAVLYSALLRGGALRRALPLALGFMLIFEFVGWWKQLLLYAGVLAKLGDLKAGVGFVYPTMEVVTTVVDRLSLLTWPMAALLIVAVALVIRTGILVALLVTSSRQQD